MSPLSKTTGTYMPQLDGIRAIAVLGVCVAHWGLGGYEGCIPWGKISVDVFFVLSGFLITGILLNMRHEKDVGLREMLRVFMVRRSLRIFPAYFVLLAMLWVLQEKMVRAHAPWCFSYTVNLLVCQLEGFPGPISHLWTLALEEQFYLVWPLLMLLVPWRWLPKVLVAAWLLGIVARWVLVFKGFPEVVVKVFPLSSLDFFAMGGILTWWRMVHAHRWKAWVSHGWMVAGPAVVLLLVGWHLHWWMNIWLITQNVFLAIACGWLIARVGVGLGGGLGRALEWKPLSWLGQISYGLYLLHNFVPNGIGRFCGFWGGLDAWNNLHWGGRFAISFAVTVGLAACSFYLLERPFLKLKNRWGVVKNRTPAVKEDAV